MSKHYVCNLDGSIRMLCSSFERAQERAEELAKLNPGMAFEVLAVKSVHCFYKREK